MNAENLLPVILGTVIITALVAFIILFVILYKKAQMRFELERQQFQQALLQTEVEIREQLLTDISRDLHDNLGQIASLVKINLAMISEDQLPQDKLRLQESSTLLRQLIDEIRLLSTSLNNQNLKATGLLTMMEKDIMRINKLGLLKLEFESPDTPPDIDPNVSVFLYRMFQEMINNILKHSGATEAQILVKDNDQQLSLQVKDNGVGIGNEIRTTSSGHGLVNIRERCKIIGAACSIESLPNKGTFIEINVPT